MSPGEGWGQAPDLPPMPMSVVFTGASVAGWAPVARRCQWCRAETDAERCDNCGGPRLHQIVT